MEVFLDVLSWVLLVGGGCIAVLSAYGVLKLPDVFTRMHAASMLDSLGSLCVFAGLALQAGFTIITAKLALVYAFMLLTSATSAHVLAKTAIHAGLEPLQGPQGPQAAGRLAPADGAPDGATGGATGKTEDIAAEGSGA